MKYLIVNGDDFGASRGINRGVMEAHRQGVLTSTSLLVKTPYAEEAAALARKVPELSVGLHADVRDTLEKPADDAQRLRESLQWQYDKFEELMGLAPTHLDSHHNVHLDSRALPHFLELAGEHGLLLREHSQIRYLSKFYGQWSGRTHLEQVGVEKLLSMLETEIGEGITELCCHPGYMDPDHRTSYGMEREVELRTLCDPRILDALEGGSVRLISYHNLPRDLLNVSDD